MKRSRLAVGARPVGLGAKVLEAELAAAGGVELRAVGVAVVGHHALGANPERVEVAKPAAKEAGRGLGVLIGQHLGVGEPGGVIDHDVDELPALVVLSPAPIAGDAVSGP